MTEVTLAAGPEVAVTGHKAAVTVHKCGNRLEGRLLCVKREVMHLRMEVCVSGA